jgi:hypothetical protein
LRWLGGSRRREGGDARARWTPGFRPPLSLHEREPQARLSLRANSVYPRSSTGVTDRARRSARLLPARDHSTSRLLGRSSETIGETRYGYGLRLRPPRGRKYISAMRATTTTTATATTETVLTARITRAASFPARYARNLRGQCQRYGRRPRERLTEPREHRQVGVKRHRRQAAHPKRGRPYSCFKRPNSRSTTARPRHKERQRRCRSGGQDCLDATVGVYGSPRPAGDHSPALSPSERSRRCSSRTTPAQSVSGSAAYAAVK